MAHRKISLPRFWHVSTISVCKRQRRGGHCFSLSSTMVHSPLWATSKEDDGISLHSHHLSLFSSPNDRSKESSVGHCCKTGVTVLLKPEPSACTLVLKLCQERWCATLHELGSCCLRTSGTTSRPSKVADGRLCHCWGCSKSNVRSEKYTHKSHTCYDV